MASAYFLDLVFPSSRLCNCSRHVDLRECETSWPILAILCGSLLMIGSSVCETKSCNQLVVAHSNILLSRENSFDIALSAS